MGLRPKRSLGQNFLVEPRLAFEVASYASQCSDILEPGAGLGVVSALLAERGWRVVSIELDKRLFEILREVAAEHARLDVVNADVLHVYFKPIDCIIGNPPYSITGPLIAKTVIEFRPRLVVYTLQREVARRIAAQPGSSDYGRITVLVKLFYNVKLGNVYRRTCFYPPPEVDSQIVILERRREIDVNLAKRVEEVTRCLFSQRNRKAAKVVRACCGFEPRGDLGEKRVYELTPEEILGIVEEGCGA